MPKNYGLIPQPASPEDYLLGTINKPILRPDGQWKEIVPTIEFQKSYETGFDSYGCVTFSALNCIETVHKYYYEEVNYSDRYTVKKSGTEPGRGNTLKAVAESIRKDGVVLEKEYPFVKSQKEYYQPIPAEVEEKAKKIDVGYEWLWNLYTGWHTNKPSILMQALIYGPIQITLNAWPREKNGIFPRNPGIPNHAVMLVGYKEGEYWEIFDHYQMEFKKLAWDYGIESPLLYSIGNEVDLVKKYEGKLFKNANSPKYYYSNGKEIAHIKNEKSFYFGRDAGFWGDWGDVTIEEQKIKEDITF